MKQTLTALGTTALIFLPFILIAQETERIGFFSSFITNPNIILILIIGFTILVLGLALKYTLRFKVIKLSKYEDKHKAINKILNYILMLSLSMVLLNFIYLILNSDKNLGANSNDSKTAPPIKPITISEVKQEEKKAKAVPLDREILETSNGIFWSDDLGLMQWEDAKAKCDSLQMKLPSIEQWRFAYNEGITRTWKQNSNKIYWTPGESSEDNVYIFSIENGAAYYGDKNIDRPVRCIR